MQKLNCLYPFETLFCIYSSCFENTAQCCLIRVLCCLYFNSHSAPGRTTLIYEARTKFQFSTSWHEKKTVFICGWRARIKCFSDIYKRYMRSLYLFGKPKTRTINLNTQKFPILTFPLLNFVWTHTHDFMRVNFVLLFAINFSAHQTINMAPGTRYI